MLTDWLLALEFAPLVAALRNSSLVYPLVNAGHIFGIALLIGCTVALDLRLFGLFQSITLQPFWRLLSRCAFTGLVIALLCGILLFSCNATEYVESRLFLFKMLILVAGTINALILHIMIRHHLDSLPAFHDASPVPVRILAALSMFVWLSVLVLGRLVAYF